MTQNSGFLTQFIGSKASQEQPLFSEDKILFQTSFKMQISVAMNHLNQTPVNFTRASGSKDVTASVRNP